MTIKQAMIKGITILKLEKISTPKLKARLLLQYVLKKPRQYLIVYDNQKLTELEEREYLKYINLLKQGEPIEHITHQKEFMKLNFYVDENVLIPRQDTEVLVEEVIKIAKRIRAKKILDLCTGSGAIAISIAKLLGKKVLVYASDISAEALKVAEENSMNNMVNIYFFKSNLFEKISNLYKFDIIVSNPPYIETKKIENLPEEVKREPKIALDGGEDGLKFYKEISKEAKKYLLENGYLAFEIGYNQREYVESILKQDRYKNIYSRKDLSGNDRVVIAQK